MNFFLDRCVLQSFTIQCHHSNFHYNKQKHTILLIQGYIFWPSPPLGGGEFLSKMKNREEFEEDFMKKGREKGGKEEKRKEKKKKRKKGKR